MRALWLALALAAASPAPSPTPMAPALRDELHRLVAEDQRVRDVAIAQLHAGKQADFAPMKAVDDGNLPRLQAILDRHGWPTPALVGKQGVNDYWLLVQHADAAFQRRCLPLAEASWRRGELAGQNYALLYDRVQTGQGKPQRYGTQFAGVNGRQQLLPLEDPAHVDDRRKAVGLPSLAEYERLIHQTYDPPATPAAKP